MTEHDLDPRLDPFERQLAQAWSAPSWQSSTVLVAVSGGPDSIALLRGLIALQPDHRRIRVAHFQHGLRGSAADADLRFVQQTCQTLNVSCEVGQATRDEYADHTAEWAGRRPFTLFENRRPVPHEFYIAHDTLLAFAGKSTVEIEFELSTPGNESLAIKWEYWDGQV